MAQFTAQGRLKLLLNSDGGRYKLVGGAFGDGFRSFHLHNGKLKFLGSATTKLHVFSASDKPRTRSKFYAEARLSSCGDSESESESESGSEGDGGSYDDDDFYGTGFDTDELACFRGLVLDISYRPVNVVCWKRAICLEFMEKADVLEYYDRTVNSPSGSYYIPAVLRVPHLLQVVKRRRIKNTLSRKNILHRDGYVCQYCSSSENLTIDHVFPVSRGGEWKWENLVTACSKCNSKKGQKTLDEVNMKLKKLPKAPKDYDLLAIPLTGAALRMLRRRKGTPDEWRQYLPAEP
ncbi:unnamed protein product [Linum trigynum]|uniref:HNH nuclease domain-containing protein n=1 Tax=Linum trigynum TaxID=586398 RepID=A0AAV2CJ86_9ROSI